MKKPIAKTKKYPEVKSDLPQPILNYIEETRLKPHPESYLIAVLQKIQEHFGFLTVDRLDAVAQLMQIPTAKVSGVANFYHFFSFVPKGKHRLTVCMGTACYVKGSGTLLERIKELLNVKPGGTTADGQFSLEAARCLGACAMAPIVVVDDKVYGNVKPDDLVKILSTYGYDPKQYSKS